jgi:predicted dehydrogenase
MPNSKRTRIGIAGCGRLAELGYGPALARMPGLELVAVADPDPGRTALLAANGAERFAGAGEMLAGAGLDGVIVCSPAGTHLELARAASEAGVPALIEKPPAASAAEARELAALPGPIWIGFNRRYTVGRELRQALAAHPEQTDLALIAQLAYRRRSWDPLGDLGDAWFDLGPHLLDLALLLDPLGDLEPVAAEIGPRRARVALRGSRMRVLLDCATDSLHRERYVLEAGGREIASRREGGLGGIVRSRLGDHPLVTSLAAQLGEWEQRLRGEVPVEPLLAEAAAGVSVMELLEAARSAAGAAAVR